MPYPVTWRGRTYQLSDLTIGLKKEFVKFAKRHLTAEGVENLQDHGVILSSYLANLYGELWWGDGGMSKPVASLLNSPIGDLAFNRLLFGSTADILSDDDLAVLLKEKEREQDAADRKFAAQGLMPPYPPVNDYMQAIQSIREAAEPKKVNAGTGVDPPGVTPSTDTSPKSLS